MAMTRMLVREIAERGLQPAEVMRRANHMLAMDNRASMFVTMIFGYYDIDTGVLRLVCAGHNPPLILSENGQTREIAVPVNLPLGAMPKTHYVPFAITLSPGETLVLYTDGVTEATEKCNEYGLDRFRSKLAGFGKTDCVTVAKSVLSDIDDFCFSEGQFDDITLLLLKRLPDVGKAPVSTMRVEDSIRLLLPAKTEILHNVATLARSFAKEIGFDDIEADRIVIALDEIVTNVIMHAYPPGSKEIIQVRLIPLDNGLRPLLSTTAGPSISRRRFSVTTAKPLSISLLAE